MRTFRLPMLFVLFGFVVLVACGKDSPTAPSGTRTPVGGGTNNPPPNHALTKGVFDYTRTTPDDKAPWKNTCPQAHTGIASGQIRQITDPEIKDPDSLSGGTLGVISCDWKVISGYANGKRYDGTDSTILTNIPTKGGQVRHYWKGESFKHVAYELQLDPNQKKTLINPGSLNPSQEGKRWFVQGPLDALTPSITSTSFEDAMKATADMIAPRFPSGAEEVEYRHDDGTTVLLKTYEMLYIASDGRQMYKLDVRQPQRGYAQIR